MNFKSIWSEKVCKIICFSVFFSLSRFKWTFALVRSNNDEPAKFRVVNTQTDGEVKKRKNELWKVSLRHTLPFLMFHNLSHIVVSSCVVVIVARMFRIMEAFGGHIMPNIHPFLFGVFWRTIQIEIYCWIRNELKYHSNTGTSFNPIRVFFYSFAYLSVHYPLSNWNHSSILSVWTQISLYSAFAVPVLATNHIVTKNLSFI